MNDIRTFSKKNLISQSIVDYLQNTIEDQEILFNILESITIAPKYYNLRINLTKTNIEEILDYCTINFPNFKCMKGLLENILQIPIKKNKIQPIYDKKVYCDKFAAESVMMGADLFYPGNKGFNGKFQKGDMMSIMLSPSQYPNSYIDSYNDSQYQRKFHVANGIATINSKDFPKYQNGILIKNVCSKFSTIKYRNTDIFSNGLISEQNFPPNLATAIFMEEIYDRTSNTNPIIFDTCSAPGHKTTAMAEWGFINSSKKNDNPIWPKIISIDRSTNRLEHLRKDINRLGLENIEVIPCNLGKIENNYPQYINKADFLMFDPPCSALGTRPKIYLEKSQKDLEDYPTNQRRLLKLVDPLLKSGGLLMYNTCTIPKEENEDIVSYAISKLNYKIINIKQKYHKLGFSGIKTDILSNSESKNIIRFYPQKEESIGYFIALLQKE